MLEVENNAPVAATPENTESVETVETSTPEAEGQEQKTEAKEEEYVPFPKKAQNAISARDRKIGRLQARLRELEAKERSGAQAPAQKTEDQGPQEKDFDTYGEYLEAKTLWKVEQRFAESKKADKEAATKQQFTEEQEHYINTRAQEVSKKSDEYSKTIQDFDEVQEQNLEVVASLPQEIKMLMLEADDPALAFYNLAKTGTLIDLADMPLHKAAMVIAKAQSQTIARQTTQAPKPLRGVTGAGASRSEDAMSGRELRKKAGLI